MTEPVVTPATEIHMDSVAAIYRHYVLHGTATFEIDPPDAREMNRRRIEIQVQGLPYVVMEDPRGVTGYAYAGPYRARPAYRFTVEYSVYVRPDSIGQGAGKRLLSEVIDRSIAAGRRQMIAIIGHSANQASIRLHAGAGFSHTGTLERVGRKFGRWLDTVVMQRELATDSRLANIRRILDTRQANWQHIADVLRESGGYRWVGLYRVDHTLARYATSSSADLARPPIPSFQSRRDSPAVQSVTARR